MEKATKEGLTCRVCGSGVGVGRYFASVDGASWRQDGAKSVPLCLEHGLDCLGARRVARSPENFDALRRTARRQVGSGDALEPFDALLQAAVRSRRLGLAQEADDADLLRRLGRIEAEFGPEPEAPPVDSLEFWEWCMPAPEESREMDDRWALSEGAWRSIEDARAARLEAAFAGAEGAERTTDELFELARIELTECREAA